MTAWDRKSLAALCVTCILLGSFFGAIIGQAATAPKATPTLLSAPEIRGDIGNFTGALTGTTLDTGQGANELYPMDQGVRSTDDVVFSSVDATEFYLNTVNITDGLPLREVDYVIQYDSNYKAINGETGATDYTETQAEDILNDMNTALPNGGVVVLRDGNFTLNDYWNINAPVKFYGQGKSTIIDIVTGFPHVNSVVRVNSSNCGIYNINFNFTNTAIGGVGANCIGVFSDTTVYENVDIIDNIFEGRILSGNSYPDNASDCTMLKVINTERGINWKITHNDFLMYGYEAVTIALNNGVSNYGEAITITNNYMKGGYGGVAIEGYSRNCVVSNNVIDVRLGNDHSYGVLICQGSYDNTITGNTISAEKSLVWVRDESSYNVISSNVGRSVWGFLIEDNATSNKFTENTIYMQPFTTTIGSYGFGGDDVNASNNEFTGNTFIGFQGGAYYVTSPTIIKNNKFINCARSQVRIGSAGTIIENNVYDGYYPDTFNLNIGIWETDTTKKILIKNNVFRDLNSLYASTLSAGAVAGATTISVTSVVGIETGARIQTSPSGFPVELNNIRDIDRTSLTITLENPLTNNHTNGDTIIGISLAKYAVYEYAISNVEITGCRIEGATYTLPGPLGLIANSIAKLDTLVLPFVDGTTFLSAGPFGWEIDANTEYAVAMGQLPSNVNRVYRWKIRAISLVAEADGMKLEIFGWGGTDNEAYSTEYIAIANKTSKSQNFAANDYIHWVLTATDDTDLDDVVGGDTIMIKVLHEVAGGADCETDAAFLCVEIEYI